MTTFLLEAEDTKMQFVSQDQLLVSPELLDACNVTAMSVGQADRFQ